MWFMVTIIVVDANNQTLYIVVCATLSLSAVSSLS